MPKKKRTDLDDVEAAREAYEAARAVYREAIDALYPDDMDVWITDFNEGPIPGTTGSRTRQYRTNIVQSDDAEAEPGKVFVKYGMKARQVSIEKITPRHR